MDRMSLGEMLSPKAKAGWEGMQKAFAAAPGHLANGDEGRPIDIITLADVLKSDDAKKIAGDLGKKVGIDEATTGQVMDAAAGFLGGAKDKD